MRKAQTTITDITKDLGISPSTVSRALNNHQAISKKTKKAEIKLALSILFTLIIATCFGQATNDEIIVSKFKSISNNPTVIEFTNTKKINNIGGHLQGIQLFYNGKSKYAFLSGSSSSYAYFSVVKLGDKIQVISVNDLMNKPFKHAGGFQIYQNYLAVGIEDNQKKDKSKVCIYDISNPENPSVEPIAIIKREGKPKRSTAGCVGIAKYNDKALLAVGDWDTKNIDFYACKFNEIEKGGFEKIQSINTDKILKEGWVDNNWHSYQNINLINFNNDLYLIGLGQNNAQEDIADIYRLNEKSPGNFNLIKLATKTFICKSESSFKAGAGVIWSETGEMQIISCGYNIENISHLNYFNNQIITAHSHNDYVHEKPLFDALDCNFKSIEADVFSIGDSLFVAHNFNDIKPGQTLRRLYLEPLKNRIRQNNGSVYGNGEEVILFIDIKDDGLRTYKLLDKILQEYKNEVSVFENGTKAQKSILVVVSGNRPFDFMQSQTIRYAGFDGRMANLDSDIPPTLMPIVSDNWSKYFKWNGKGEIPLKEKQKLYDIAHKAKSKGYILRFWNTPNRTTEQRNAVWTELKNAGVGLIGADNLKEMQQFFIR